MRYVNQFKIEIIGILKIKDQELGAG